MMLLVVIAWVLVIANAPWWIWTCFIVHIMGSFFAWMFGDNQKLDNLIDKLK